jgi:2-dehydropantoate 2-reductase
MSRWTNSLTRHRQCFLRRTNRRSVDTAHLAVEAVGVAPSPEFIAAAKAGLTATGSTQTSSMYRDLQRGVPIEADQIIGDLVERARLAGIETPLLAAIYTHLCVHQRRVLA